jgi:D-xylose transport system substrate-binding protein
MLQYSSKLTGAAVLAIASATSAGTIARGADISGSTVAFLMPDQGSTRYEEHDHPGFVAEMKKLCESCKVIYLNADTDAAKQQQQFNSVIAQGAKVIVLDPVDSSAAASLVHNAQSQGVKVIAYDRPIPDAKADFYVSFDNQAISKAIASSFVELLKSKGVSADGDVGVLEINGSPTDAAAGLIKKGRREATRDSPRARTRCSPNTTRRTGCRPMPSNGRPDRSRALAARSSASSRRMTEPRAAPLQRSKRPASIRYPR